MQKLVSDSDRMLRAAFPRVRILASSFTIPLKPVRPLATALVVTGMIAATGCATLDARPELDRVVASATEATGAATDLVLIDSEAASAKSSELLRDGLTADEAVQVAFLNNPRARAAILEVGVSRADFVQSTLFTNPSIALSLRFPDGGGLANFEAAFTQNIAELWLIPRRKEVARRQLEQSVIQTAQTLAAIAYETRQAYIRALRAGEEESVAQETLDLAQQLLDVARLRQQAGTGSEFDVNLALTRQLEAETDQRRASLAVTESRSALFRILGMTERPDAVPITGTLPDPTLTELDAQTLQRVAGENRLDLQVAAQIVEEAERRVHHERARFLRSIEVGLAMERSERRSRGRRDWAEETFYDSLQANQFSAPSFVPRDEQESDFMIGPTLGLELPLWDQNQAQIVKAERQWEQARRMRDAMWVDVSQEIHTRLARARIASENAVAYREQLLPAAEKNVTLSREAYKVGRVSLLAVLEAQRGLLSARSAYLDALESAAVANIELEQATGRPYAALLSANETNEFGSAIDNDQEQGLSP